MNVRMCVDWEDEEGVFLKKKQEGDDYFMPSKQLARRKSKKEKSKQSTAKVCSWEENIWL